MQITVGKAVFTKEHSTLCHGFSLYHLSITQILLPTPAPQLLTHQEVKKEGGHASVMNLPNTTMIKLKLNNVRGLVL